MSGLQRTNSMMPIKETIPTEDTNKIRVETYAKKVGMDAANTEAAVIMATQGPTASAKFMMESSGNDYFAMRSKFG